MKKVKQIGFYLGLLFLITGVFSLGWLWDNWTIRYSTQLDRFFGEGNWEVVSEDVHQSNMYTVRVGRHYKYGQTKEAPALYREWNILCKNTKGQKEVWKISNHAYKINNAEYGIFSSKRYKAGQALTLELMDISFALVEEEVHNEIVKAGLTEEEANCIYVDMAYHGGNPKGSFYDKLARESWFTLDGVTAENYLASDLYEFYLLFRIHDYRLEQLSEQEQQNVVNSLTDIEKRMLEKYGDQASFEILYGDYNVEY